MENEIDVMHSVARRLREVRLDLYGERGAGLLAEKLGIPFRTWLNYESGVSLPGLVMLRFLHVTGVAPFWLLTGSGDRRAASPSTVIGRQGSAQSSAKAANQWFD